MNTTTTPARDSSNKQSLGRTPRSASKPSSVIRGPFDDKDEHENNSSFVHARFTTPSRTNLPRTPVFIRTPSCTIPRSSFPSDIAIPDDIETVDMNSRRSSNRISGRAKRAAHSPLSPARVTKRRSYNNTSDDRAASVSREHTTAEERNTTATATPTANANANNRIEGSYGEQRRQILEVRNKSPRYLEEQERKRKAKELKDLWDEHGGIGKVDGSYIIAILNCRELVRTIDEWW